jgi:hypothetical protein
MCFLHGGNRTAFTCKIIHLNILICGGFWHSCGSRAAAANIRVYFLFHR